MNIIKIYLTGLLFLAAALAVNTAAKWLGLNTWYDFLNQPRLTPTTAVWLFVVYPFVLGLLVLVLKQIW